ncbi:WD40 repeat protein [Nannizzia gypsea CBS 118893]|uniref:WD40 repeat protein n=1 Tax=Arthroderma gypseum (strain ATCC MYA-4604 / CBS 118893) TaxID=535722 RepID=E4V5X7_ARTGP|nr:WD40 repeat protein [Nannizzia gypsea CBS 118893]EFR05502.1 WD40 repeat protein [Nannizzia gypsea CBS 118893]
MKITIFSTASLLATAALAGNAWQVRFGLTSSAYQETFNELVKDGYRLEYATGFSDLSGDARYNAIFEKPSASDKIAWIANHGLTPEKYSTAFDDLKDKEYRPLHVQGYNVGKDPTSGKERRFTSIWHKNSGKGAVAWEERTDISGDKFTELFQQLVEKGYRLRSLSGYAVGSQQRFSGVFEKRAGPAWKAYAGLNGDEYQKKFEDLKKDGFYPVQIVPYNVDGKVWYSGIWEKVDAEAAKPYTRYGLTGPEYQDLLREWKGKGYRPTSVAGYIDGKTLKYASIFNKA